MKRIKKFVLYITAAIAVVAATLAGLYLVDPAFAQSTAKSLATNFTLVNLGTTTATVSIAYSKESDGAGGGGDAWAAAAANTNFTIGPNGGQYIIRQYTDGTLTPGKGSAVVSSDQQLGAVAQVLANYPGAPAGQAGSNGAYSGFSQAGDKFYAPLLSRRGSSASGTVNSQIMIQNAGTGNVTVQVRFLSASGNYTKTGIVIPQGASYYYDLDTENNLTPPWFGSAVIETVPTGGQIVAVVNFFLGADNLQTYNAFSSSSLGTSWVVPLFISRLAANGLNTPVTVQNLSGASMNPGSIQMSCVKDAGSSAITTTFTISNAASVADSASVAFNPVTDASIPGDWYGACRVTAPGNVASFVQMRYVGGTSDPGAAAHEAINASGTATKVFVPLIAKRLGNGFSTAATIVNLSSTQPATVTLTYQAGAGSPGTATLTASNVVIPAGGSLIQNQRLAAFQVATAGDMIDGWFGTLSVQSTGTPIHAFVQLTNILVPAGDTFMAHNAFTQ
jgi:hypothetical protein